MSDNISKDLTIDPERLDAEWIVLPSVYYQYREEADILDIRARKKKLQLDFEMAKLDGEVRLEPVARLGVEKPTEAQIRCYIESHETIYNIRCEMLEIEKKKKMVASICSGLEMKRDALKNLVQLINSEYYSIRRTNGELTKDLGDINATAKRIVRRDVKSRLNQKGE